MARLGRGRPNRPYVAREPYHADTWTLRGAAHVAAGAVGTVSFPVNLGGVSSVAVAPRGIVGGVFGFVGVSSVGVDGRLSLTVVEPNLAEFAAAALANGTTTIVRRVDLFEADGVTPYLLDVDAVAWSVSVNDGSGPRRTMTATIHADDGALLPQAGGLGFDKIVRIWRGVVLDDRGGDVYVWPVGVFEVEPIVTSGFPKNTVELTGADFAARLDRATYSTATTFAVGTPIESVVETLAAYGGVTNVRLEETERILSRDLTIETDTTIWSAIEKVAADNGCEVFFDAAGWLVLRVIVDSDTLPVAYTFETGERGSLVAFRSERSRGRLFNHWPVRGESADSDTAPVWASSENDSPTSPTAISKIGRQTAPVYVSPMIVTEDDAQIVADARRSLGAILDRSASITGLVVPGLDVGMVVAVEEPNPDPGQPETSRWRLSSFTITSELGPTDYAAFRVETVA